MFGAIAGGIASALAGGAMSKLFGGGQKAASGGIHGDVLATDNNTVGMGDAGIKSAIQGSNVPNPDEAVPSFVSGAMAKAGKGLIMVTLHEVITFLVSMQISISSLQTHNVNRCGRSRHLARKLSLRRKRSSPNVFEMAATETITSIILIKLIRVSLGTVRHP